jgi:hypothetical protein
MDVAVMKTDPPPLSRIVLGYKWSGFYTLDTLSQNLIN